MLARYDELVRRLSWRLGSSDTARDVLHDVYLKVERSDLSADIRQPFGYVMRMAVNIAANKRRAERRLLSIDEVEALLDPADDAPGPDRLAEGRSDMRAVERALTAMPERRRAIFLAAWVEGVAHPAIAERHGIALRTVQHEMKLASDTLRGAVTAKNVIPLRAGRGQVS
jgi:RNA polymerase sigma factor (sigma-70 family)